MHLKSIELAGFKSFADRTILDLKEGISAIVGPNGCGKSNIVDAMRWCLGEMSAKSLRSRQMLDVLFAGAAGRAALNFAEVTLTFENTHHLLPIDFAEVQVTRRLHRSGESEYLLNKTPCRLKDIRDLFLDTGLGEGYSILAQGEVDFVMNAKPEERRELFEEAAGISKYKARREETLRKLEKVEVDMNRLNDLLSVLKEQMDRLESASRKAQQYQKLKEELKSLSIRDFLFQWRNLSEGIETSQKRLDELRAQMDQESVKAAWADAETAQNQIQRDEIERILLRENHGLAELDRGISSRDQRIAIAREKERSSAEHAEKSGQRLEQIRPELGQTDARLESERKELDSKCADLQGLSETLEKDRKDLEQLFSERRELEKLKEQISSSLRGIAEELAGIRNEKNSKGAYCRRQELELESLKKEQEKYSREKSRCKAEIEKYAEELGNLDASSVSHAKETDSLQEQKSSVENELEELRRNLNCLRQNIMGSRASLSSVLERLSSNPYGKGTQAVLKHGFEGLRGVVGTLFKYSGNMGPWVESFLGNRSNFLVFNRQDQAERAVSWLKENNLGRSVCIVLERVPVLAVPDLSSIPNANSLLPFVHADPGDPDLEKLKNYLFSQAFLRGNTLYHSELIDGGSEIVAGDGESLSQNLFGSKQRHEEEVRLLSEEIEVAETRVKNLEEKLAEILGNLSGKRAQLDKCALQKEMISGKLTEIQKEDELNSRAITWAESECGRMIGEMNASREAQGVLDGKERQVLDSQGRKEQERAGLDSEFGELAERESILKVRMGKTEVLLEQIQSQQSRIQSNLNELSNSRDRLEKSLKETESEIMELQNGIREAKQIQAEEGSKILELQQKRAAVMEGLEKLLQEKSRWDQKIQSLDEEIKNIRERTKQLTEVSHQVEIGMRAGEHDRKNLAERLQNECGVAPQSALDSAGAGVELTGGLQDEIAKLRKRVESLSNTVNLAAPEEYKDLSDRHQFLNSQLQDLVKAREDLKGAIAQINSATQAQFRDTFEKVRENFRGIYATLFEGGTADLLITEDKNVLDCGVEIVAQPPGKKLQSIALLSGGEKALTAIALLFAFFMVKPSPFCILDEVDAPWDPANVSRFLNLLKTFSQKTQFLVVTHNPKTMETADIIFGITMEEAGISKILSTRLVKEKSTVSAN